MATQTQMYPDNFGLPLGGSQDWLMNMDHPITNNNSNNINNCLFNLCGLNEFSFNLQQKFQQQQFQYQQLQQQQQHQQQLMVQLQNLQQSNHSLPSDNGYIFLTSSSKTYNHSTTAAATTTTNHMPVNFSQTFATQIDKQRHEIDRCISLQNERLKLALQVQRKQQLAVMLKKVEEKATMLLRQKDEEIAKARKRAMELEEMTRKMEVDSQAWQRLAAENQAMVVSLSNKLEELKEQACCLMSSNAVDDAESCCEYPPGNRGIDEEEGTRETRKKVKTLKMLCRVCNSGNASILFLPCRHLCSCKACEAFLDSCPVCEYPKRATIEGLIS